MGKITVVRNKAGAAKGKPPKAKTEEAKIRTPQGLVIPDSILKRGKKNDLIAVNATAVNLREIEKAEEPAASSPAIRQKTPGELSRVAAYCRVSTLQEEQDLSYETL